MGKTLRDVREIQASTASELAYTALSLTGEPGIEYVQALMRIKMLVEILETTVTAVLTHSGVSWEQLGKELDGVTRQSIHRRLNPKVMALMDSDAQVFPLFDGPKAHGVRHFPRADWVKHLKRLEADLHELGQLDYHPHIVKHQRRRAGAG